MLFQAVPPAAMNGRHSATAFRPLAALFLLLAVLLGGTIEAAACEPEAVAFEQIDISSHDGDDQNPGGKTEQHGLCSHGHCHHSPQLIDSPNNAAPVLAATSTHFGLIKLGLRQASPNLVKEPPRA